MNRLTLGEVERVMKRQQAAHRHKMMQEEVSTYNGTSNKIVPVSVVTMDTSRHHSKVVILMHLLVFDEHIRQDARSNHQDCMNTFM
jgi:hypothetical protein